jgi:hypothetical protein
LAEEEIVSAEERFREADAAWVSVEQIEVWFEKFVLVWS